MKNFVQPGKVLTLTAPTGGVVSGTPYLIGSLFGVAQQSAEAAEKFDLARRGVFEFPKATATAWSEGTPLYWDNTAKNVTTDAAAGANPRVATAVAAAAIGATIGKAVII